MYTNHRKQPDTLNCIKLTVPYSAECTEHSSEHNIVSKKQYQVSSNSRNSASVGGFSDRLSLSLLSAFLMSNASSSGGPV